VRGRLDLDGATAADDLIEHLVGHADDALGGSEHVDEVMEIVAAHVKGVGDAVLAAIDGEKAHVPGSCLPGGPSRPGGRRRPGRHGGAASGEVGKGGIGLTDEAIVDGLASGLPGSAVEGIGGPTAAQAFGVGQGQVGASLLAIDGKGLFAIEVLAGLQDLFTDLAMAEVGREADDDLDLRIGEELFGC